MESAVSAFFDTVSFGAIIVLVVLGLGVTPTTPMTAQPLPAPDASREEYVQRALEMMANTAPFDISRHPAMAIPCGMSDGLPVSVMLI